MMNTAAPLIGNARVRTGILGRPIIDGVTSHTIESEHPGMERRVAVAVVAHPRQPGELTRRVTALARHSRVAAYQWEFGTVVIEVGIVPTGGVMAESTIRAIFAVVLIILLMAGIAIRGCALELLVYMT